MGDLKYFPDEFPYKILRLSWVGKNMSYYYLRRYEFYLLSIGTNEMGLS